MLTFPSTFTHNFSLTVLPVLDFRLPSSCHPCKLLVSHLHRSQGWPPSRNVIPQLRVVLEVQWAALLDLALVEMEEPSGFRDIHWRVSVYLPLLPLLSQPPVHLSKNTWVIISYLMKCSAFWNIGFTSHSLVTPVNLYLRPSGLQARLGWILKNWI